MKKTIITLTTIIAFIVGCGGGGSTSKDTSVVPAPQGEILKEISEVHKDPVIQKVIDENFQNLIDDAKLLSKDNYTKYYKRMNALRFVSIPDLNVTFDLKNNEQNDTQANKSASSYQKVIYESTWSRKDEYKCLNGGTVSKEVELYPRGDLEADTYKANDNTNYSYSQCDMGDVLYDGSVNYHVNDFTKFDFTFGAIALGTFDSEFMTMSIETATQKVTLNGTIRYKAFAERTPEPDGELIKLEVTYATVGDYEVTVYDKNTGETTQLVYNGVLDKTVFSDGASTSSGVTAVETVIPGYMYRKSTDYTLNIESDGRMVTLQMADNISGLTNTDGSLQPPRPIGTDISNLSVLRVSEHSIYHMILADGTSRYILDSDTDFYPDANIQESEPQNTLPPSDVDLMNGVVVIGFDTCVPTTLLRQNLDALGIEYSYVNIYATQQEYDTLSWFNVSSVPYVGINGSFFQSLYDKNAYAVVLNLYGYDMNDTLVEQNRPTSASVFFKEKFDDLQTKETHTAMAVAYDTPYNYYTHRAWGWSSAEKAQDEALTKCEEGRITRESRGAKEIKSVCQIYSVDGVRQ